MMFLQDRAVDIKIQINEKDFGKPVETIMKCGDFKSNFARRLSNRYVLKPCGTNNKQESEVTEKSNCNKHLLQSTKEIASDDFINDRKEDGAPTPAAASGVREVGCGGEEDDRERTSSGHDLHRTQLASLNTQIDTLRWQLRQTESNRQMHIALLEQVVSFLRRVREHMDVPDPPAPPLAPPSPRLNTKVLQSSFSRAELPRSRSTLHVNGDADGTLASRNISKSSTNVHGLHRAEFAAGARTDGAAKYAMWKQSKLSLLEETKSSKKIAEEISRIIELADTVLTIKLPHLSCCTNSEAPSPPECTTTEPIATDDAADDPREQSVKQSDIKTHNKNTFHNVFILNTSSEWTNGFDAMTNEYIEAKDQSIEKFSPSPSPLTCGLEEDFAAANLGNESEAFSLNSTSKLRESKKPNANVTKRNEKKRDIASVCIEDESGFSSMSSFQEIGIPIINVIPPTPSKELFFLPEDVDAQSSVKEWKAEVIDIDKQSMKVFWV